MTRRVYMDNSATTAVRQEVVDAMLPFFTERFGNASSAHGFGREANTALEDARAKIAAAIGARPAEIIFTSGGTESDNLAIKGVAHRTGKGHIITSAIEHPAVLNTVATLEKQGFEVTHLPVDRYGMVGAADLDKALREDTILVSIMAANNEVGTILPIRELAAVADRANVPFHTDAVQALGKIPVNVDDWGVDMLSMSGHKFYGPKGIGALYVRAGTRLAKLQHGGHHEKNRRAGTENVPGAVGMATALELACAEMPQDAERLRVLRNRLSDALIERVPDAQLNGHPTRRLPHLVNMTFENVEGESVLLSLDAFGIAVSTGSACSSGSLEPSHVLLALGIPAEKAHGSIRFSLGRDNTAEDIAYVLEKLPPVIERLRAMSPFAS